jgi:hypothetical protein
MPSKYFQNYQNAVEFNLVEDLYNEAIFMQGFSGYYIPNTNEEARDLIYGDDPLKAFTVAYKLDTYLVNTMDYGDEQDFFSKFGLEVRNQLKIQFTVKEFHKRTQNIYIKPREGDLIYIPFMKDTGELFEIKFVNTSKDLYTLGRIRPFYYELSLEPFKYNDESIDTGVAGIDAIEISESIKTTLDIQSGNGSFIIGETVYQGDANTYIAKAEIIGWDEANTVLTVINVSGSFSNTNAMLITASVSNSSYTLTQSDNRLHGTQFDNLPLLDEISGFAGSDNPFGSLTYY